MQPNWQTDRTRYMTGWDCAWRRFLGYHAFNGGITRRQIYPALAIGIYVHQALEQVLANKATNQSWAAAAVAPALRDFRQHVAGTEFPVEEGAALIEGIAHCYSRIAMPWLTDEFTIIGIEAEDSLYLPDGLEWMYRPDFITEHKQTGSVAVHDFKTASSWNERRDTEEYRDNVQMMMNAHCVEKKLDRPVDYYYMHILMKGNDYAPSPLIKPYVRPAVPPFQAEDWQPYRKYTDPSGAERYLNKSYSRVNVWEHRQTADWVWAMPEEAAAKQIIVVGPYEVNRQKVQQFRRGMIHNERHWRDTLDGLAERWGDSGESINWQEWWPNLSFQEDLDRTFPRTYNCYTYGTRCQFYSLCHKHDRWNDPLGSGDYEKRVPHHPQEVTDGTRG